MGIMSDQAEDFRPSIGIPGEYLECCRVLRHRSLEVPNRQDREGSHVRQSRMFPCEAESHALLRSQALRFAILVTVP